MKLYLFAVVIILLGCQQTSDQIIVKKHTEKSINKKFNCQQSTVSPLKSTKKLKEMLLANGKIDASLSDKEIDHAVQAYIRKKNAAINNKNCKN
jgi:hypothetical protein